MCGATGDVRGRTLKCPIPGCDREVAVQEFTSEEALVSSAKGLVRKPKAVRRIFRATCPDHGKVSVADYGHHITSSEAVGFIADEEWQQIAFAVMELYGGCPSRLRKKPFWALFGLSNHTL